MCSIKLQTEKDDADVKKKAKGIPTQKVNKLLKFQDYYNTLMENIKRYIKFNTKRSFNQSLTIKDIGLIIEHQCHMDIIPLLINK